MKRSKALRKAVAPKRTARARLPRSLRHPAVAKVLGAFDRVVTSPVRAKAIAEGHGDVWLSYFMQDVTLSINDGFCIPGGWSDEGARAVLVAWITNCPDAYLREAVKEAVSEAKDIIDYERKDAEEQAAMGVQ